MGCFSDRVTALGLNFVGDNLTKITSNYTSVVEWASDPWKQRRGTSLVWKIKEGFLRRGQFEGSWRRRGRLFSLGRSNNLNKERSTNQRFVFPVRLAYPQTLRLRASWPVFIMPPCSRTSLGDLGLFCLTELVALTCTFPLLCQRVASCFLSTWPSASSGTPRS